MKCRGCGFVIWNLRQPRCTECGRTVDPRGWEYVPECVRYGCPHCDHLFAPQPWQPGWTVCRVCHAKFHWREVRIVPIVDDLTRVLRRSRRPLFVPWPRPAPA